LFSFSPTTLTYEHLFRRNQREAEKVTRSGKKVKGALHIEKGFCSYLSPFSSFFFTLLQLPETEGVKGLSSEMCRCTITKRRKKDKEKEKGRNS
jgi:hypothetical protein